MRESLTTDLAAVSKQISGQGLFSLIFVVFENFPLGSTVSRALFGSVPKQLSVILRKFLYNFYGSNQVRLVKVALLLSFAPVPLVPGSEVEWNVGTWFYDVIACGGPIFSRNHAC